MYFKPTQPTEEYLTEFEKHLREICPNIFKDYTPEKLREYVLSEFFNGTLKHCWIMTDDNKKVGLISYQTYEWDHMSYICEFAIFKPYRRKSYGTAAVSHFISSMHLINVNHVFFDIMKTNTDAVKFWNYILKSHDIEILDPSELVRKGFPDDKCYTYYWRF